MLLIDLQFFTVYIPRSIKKFYWTNNISFSLSQFTPSCILITWSVYSLLLSIFKFMCVCFKAIYLCICHIQISMNFNSELQQIYSLVRDSIKHTNFFDQQKMNFGKFIFFINDIKMSHYFLFDGHQIIIIWWTSKRFKNSEMLQNFSIPKGKTIWELSQFDSSHSLRMLYFPNI